jgi:hypothetical protein
MFGPGFDTTLFETGGKGRNLIAGNHLYMPSGDGGRVLYSVGFDGKPDWCHTVSAPATVASGYPDRDATVPVAAGDGTLIVTAGDAIIAFENGGTGSVGCQVNAQGVGPPAPPSPPGGSFPPATAGPSLAIQAGRRELFLGQRTNLTGRLSGIPLNGSTRVTIETDEFPYDEKWRTSGRGAVNPDGTFAFKYSPRRNARLRARAADLLSEPVEILADFPSVTRVLGRRGPRPRVRWTIFAYRGAKFRQRRVHGYLWSGNPLAWRRVDSRRWKDQALRPRHRRHALPPRPPGPQRQVARLLPRADERRLRQGDTRRPVLRQPGHPARHLPVGARACGRARTPLQREPLSRARPR